MNRLPILLAVALIFARVDEAHPCGPFMDNPVFAHRSHPDRPFTNYASGRLGVLRPSYEPMHLVWAYRWMTGIPATAEEQAAVINSWMREHGDREPSVDEEVKAWTAARKTLGRADDVVVNPYSETDYGRWQRINGDALTRAAKSAELLSAAWKKWPRLQDEWLAAQDHVFAACAETLPFSPLTEELDAGLPEKEKTRRRDERAYQQAARELYCGDHAAAAEQFEKIAASKTSRWRPWGRLLAARALVRHHLTSSVGEAALADKDFAAWYGRAKGLLEANLKDASAKEAHAATRRVLGHLKFRVEPKERRCELLARVLEKNTGTALESELVDLNLMTWTGAALSCPKLKGAPADLELWLTTTAENLDSFSSLAERPRQFPVAFAQWRKSKAPQWLVTALMKADSKAPDVPELIEAAKKLPPDSPIFPTVAAWAAHLLRDLGRGDDARALLAAVPAQPAELVSTHNLLNAERLKSAKTMQELSQLAVRPLAGMDSEGNWSDAINEPVEKRPRAFDSDARSAMSPRLTAARLLELARSPALPKGQMRQALWTAFTRATVVKDDATVQEAAKALAEVEPSAAQELKTLLGRPTPEDRRFDALVLVMGLPVTTPILEPGLDVGWDSPNLSLINDQSWRRNWWCAPQSQPVEIVSWPFLSDLEARKAQEEWTAILAAGNATTFFSNEAIAFAKAHPEDTRSPIALYRAVRTSKRGCGGGTEAATAAFRLLHQKYGSSEWAKKTKYVY